MTVQEIKNKVETHGFEFYESDDKPFNLNIVAVRNKEDKHSNGFNDTLYIVWKNRNHWNKLEMACTTDAGKYYRENLMNEKGTAIIQHPQQIKGGLKNGLHKGRTALEQAKPFKYWRDNDEDVELNLSGKTYYVDASTNIHNASKDSRVVGKWSAGCPVIANEADYELLTYVREQAEKFWGKYFTFTII